MPTRSSRTGSVAIAADSLGYEGVLIVTNLGTAASNNTMKLQQSSDNGGSDDFSDIAGTSLGVGSSDEILWDEVHRPGKRYLRAYVSRGTSTTCETIYALLYNPYSVPVTNVTSGTIYGESAGTPDEGTA